MLSITQILQEPISVGKQAQLNSTRALPRLGIRAWATLGSTSRYRLFSLQAWKLLPLYKEDKSITLNLIEKWPTSSRISDDTETKVLGLDSKKLKNSK